MAESKNREEAAEAEQKKMMKMKKKWVRDGGRQAP